MASKDPSGSPSRGTRLVMTPQQVQFEPPTPALNSTDAKRKLAPAPPPSNSVTFSSSAGVDRGMVDLRRTGSVSSKAVSKDLFSFRATDVLNYDLADVRLPGAVPDPLRPGQTRLAAPIPSNTISTRNAKLPGAPSSSASAAAAATKKKTIDLNGPAIPALSAQALSSTAPASPDHASPSAHENKPRAPPLSLPLLRDLMLPADSQFHLDGTSPPHDSSSSASSGRGHSRGSAKPNQNQQNQKQQQPMDASALLAAHAMTLFDSDATPGGDEELAEVALFRNGQEAISFFARNGANTPVKFVYCARRTDLQHESPFALRHVPSGGGSGVFGEFRPYDLAVVPRKEAPKEYYTISASGVMHVAPDSPSEFSTLSDWMRSSTLFNVLTSLPTFRYYMVKKVFRMWRAHVRHQLYLQQRARLSRSLFLAKETFCGPLLEVNRQMQELQAIRLTNIKQQTIPVQDFVKDQTDKRAEAANKFQEAVDRLQSIMDRVCAEVRERARSGGFTSSAMMTGASDEASALKSKSMVAIKEAAAARERFLRNAALEENMLGEFVRLVDYMTVENLVLNAMHTNQDLLDSLQQPRKQGLFLTTLMFGPESMEFVPTADDVNQVISRSIDGIISSVNSVPRLLFMKSFQSAVAPAGGAIEGPRIDWMIRHSLLHVQIKQLIDARIQHDFHEAIDLAQVFESYRPIHNFTFTWSYENYVKSEPSVDQLKSELQQISRWYNDVEKNMRSGFPAGMFHIESRKLKQHLSPKIEAALNHLKELLLKTFSKKCADLVLVFYEKRKQLNNMPEQLKQFASFVDRINALKQERGPMEMAATQVETMSSLLRQFEVRIPPADVVQLDSLREARKDFDSTLSALDAQINEKMPGMRENVDKNIARLNTDLTQIREQLQNSPFIDEDREPDDIIRELERVKVKLDSIKEQINTVSTWQSLFEMEAYTFNLLPVVLKEFESRNRFWVMYREWLTKSMDWEDADFSQIDVEDLAKQVTAYYKESFSFVRESNNSPLTLKVKTLVDAWRTMMPVLTELGNKAMKRQHWVILLDGIRKNAEKAKNEQAAMHAVMPPSGRISIAFLIEVGSFSQDNRGLVSDVVAQATNENQLQTSVENIRRIWEKFDFKLNPYREYKDVFTLTEIDEVMQQLEEHQLQLQTMLGSRYVNAVREEVDIWDRKLNLVSEILDEWLNCQRNWMYLETIFSAPDIQKQMPAESKRFFEVDRHFKDVMRKTNRNPNVIAACELPNLLTQFVNDNKELDQVQKQLEEYLETKRSAFPRFYFLSNDELLAILSKTREPSAVQPHLRKCFDSIISIQFNEPPYSHEVLAMVSAEGEVVHFHEKVATDKGVVEDWLNGLEAMMQATIRHLCSEALINYPKNGLERDKWFFDYPAQPISVVDQIMWTDGAMKAIQAIGSGTDKNAMKEFLEFSKKQIDSMVDLVRTDLKFTQRATLSSLIVLDVHARDVVQKMINQEVKSLNDFEWTKQLRYYWEADPINDCIVRQTNARFQYGHEYLGCTSRLVITPLTDQCFLTLTGALHLRFGGAPAGPAGTGKTESVKDLSKSLGIQIVVFNCSDGLTYSMMGRFFSGLVQAGAWACFDEFNRIDIEVLSVIAQQILTIQQAIAADKAAFDFMGRTIPATRARFGVFITMNPGYAGRTELPDNLKALFRPMAMMIPDYALIAQISLFSEGFKTATVLSKKMAKLYSLASEQLSKQDHYDFGMRAVKSVLVMAGQLKRSNPNLSEDVLLIRAMRDSNVPKFLEHDLPLFFGIISDLFPGVEVPFIDYGKLKVNIEDQLTKAGLQCVDRFITKVIQLHETMIVRHGVMLVGSTASGKSTCALILARALTQLGHTSFNESSHYRTIEQLTLNPKAITMGELYGEVNPNTKEWTDGLVAKLVREACDDTSPTRKWVTFDGPVDALWIENMNTVLDDNKTLCLANAERIKLKPTLTMCFEVEDLAVASPATVSRCGMVFLEPIHLGWKPLISSWKPHFTAKLPPTIPKTFGSDNLSLADTLERWLLGYVPATLGFLRDKCVERIVSVDNNLVTSCLTLLDAMFTTSTGLPAECTQDQLNNLVPLYFCFAFIWSFGGNLVDESRVKFSHFVKGPLGLATELVPSLTELNSVYDVCVNSDKQAFVQWANITEKFVYNPNIPYFNILVPTADTTLTSYLLTALMSVNRNVLISGDTGVGKTVMVQDYLQRNVEHVANISVMFSAQTSSKNFQDVLETKLERKRKNLFGPPAGKKMAVFVDDLNMPQPEQYGAQPPIELLRQCLDNGGFYDRKKLTFNKVKDVLFLAACGPPGGGRNKITNRVIRHYHLLWQPQLSRFSMLKIFVSILQGFLSFSPNLAQLASPITEASVEIYSRITAELLPTPSKSHYTFNLRDMSKVVQGILMIAKDCLPNRESLLNLWLHESARVFRDRLIDEKDRSWFNSACEAALLQYFGVEWKTEQFENILFGDYTTQGDNRPYKECPDFQQVTNAMNAHLADYNELCTKMDLVLFRDAINHLSRICRILRQPRGNALLVGVGGSGRQSLTRLAAFIVGQYKCMSIEITRGYNVDSWHEDLKKLLRVAGANNQPVVFLFSDSHIVKESFLEDVNNLLNAGEVPNLFEADELDDIVNKVRPLAKAAGKLDNRDNVLSHFVQLVRENLHIVLAFSPIGDKFRARCRRFPSLVNCCTIDWFNAWPQDALFSVADYFFKSNTELGIADVQHELCQMCVKIHSSVSDISGRFFDELRRHNYTTPTSYLELINIYTSMLLEQRREIQARVKRYAGGYLKLQETNGVVEQLKIDLTNLQPVLTQASKDTEQLLVELEKDQAEANVQRELCAKDAAECEVTASRVKVIKDDCQKDLDEALPAYEDAIKALNTLQKDHIGEVKRFANPPALVAFCMEAVCILFNRKPTWPDAQKLLGELDFLDRCKNFERDKISPATIKKLEKYVKSPDFKPDKMASVSSAATSLCKWVNAMNIYATVAREIEPKKKALEEAEAELQKAQSILFSKQESLRIVEQRLAALQAKYEESLAKKEQLERDAEKTKQQLVRAEQLVSGLGEEGARWSATAETLQRDLVNVVGNMILSAGCIAYLGPFTAAYRAELVSGWVTAARSMRIPVDPKFELVRILSDPVKVREWNINGLPADQYSTENGLFVARSRRWPLMIDPQGQANRWIKNTYKKKSLNIIKFSDTSYLRTLENAIRYGQPVLLENVETSLDPSIEPILLKQVVRKGGQLVLRLGDSDVPYSPDFRLDITTKLPNPHYLPETFVKVTIINFTVTPRGLEDQLLVTVCSLERADLEERNDRLIVQIAADQAQLAAIEDEILSRLSNSQGFILDDIELIEALGQSKIKSSEVKERVVEAEKTMEEINTTREMYRVVSRRGSTLYFVIADMALIDPMYQYSLLYFTKLYAQRIQKSAKSDVLAERLAILVSDITESMYVMICRGLFEKDKLLFSFLMAVNIGRVGGTISEEEWNFFVRGPSSTAKNVPPNPQSDWLRAASWQQLVSLDSISAFNGITAALSDPAFSKQWRAFFDAEGDFLKLIPSQFASLTPFQKLLLLKIIKEEKIVFGTKEYVAQDLGQVFVEALPFNLDAVYQDSTSTSPIIFVLSPGADPMASLTKLARQKGLIAGSGAQNSDDAGNDRFSSISLGQGQGPFAKEMIERAKRDGGWVCLQNCHLAVSWLPQLERIVELLPSEDVHPDFRLWLSSMPTAAFPIPVLQTGIKITNEPPKGLKANIMRTFTDLDEADYESCPKMPQAFKKLLFGLAFFHAVGQERRKFGAIGFNIPYEWMTSDFQVSMMQLRMYLSEQPEIPWQTLFEIIGEVNYGGRVTDDKDQRCVRSLLSRYITPEILDDNYKFSESGKYYAPPVGDLASVRNYIKSLPLHDPPSTFGLHDNADIVFQQKETNYLLQSVISIQPRVSKLSGGKSTDDVVGELAADIEARLPNSMSREMGHATTFATTADGSMNSLGVFLLNEMTRFNKLLSVIRSSLKELQRAIKGLVVMSAELEAMYNRFLFNQVPVGWERAAYPSLKPLASWVDDLIHRVEFMTRWLVQGPPPCFWVSGFFFPQGFMTAVLQVHSRRHRIAIDTLKFRTTVMNTDISDIQQPPKSGTYIYGLHLQGAAWSRQQSVLVESQPGVLFVEMPPIWLEPILQDEPLPANSYNCPVYKTSTRAGELSTTGHSTNFVLFLQLTSDKPSNHWVRRGTALLTQLDN